MFYIYTTACKREKQKVSRDGHGRHRMQPVVENESPETDSLNVLSEHPVRRRQMVEVCCLFSGWPASQGQETDICIGGREGCCRLTYRRETGKRVPFPSLMLCKAFFMPKKPHSLSPSPRLPLLSCSSSWKQGRGKFPPVCSESEHASHAAACLGKINFYRGGGRRMDW